MQNVLALQLFDTESTTGPCVSSYSGCPSNVSYVQTRVA